ncbi:hypothetical protein B0H34DRAFT_676390 [Crassisporium funariophilum]|nr:hypothetical protein B0H34DRAFT_676390 [Crassisporium funariophilum]
MLWLCIGEINALKIDDGHRIISNTRITAAAQDDDPANIHDWQTYCLLKEKSSTVPGHRTTHLTNQSHYFRGRDQLPLVPIQSTVLVALAASVFQQLLASNVKNVPKFSPTIEYPYRECMLPMCVGLSAVLNYCHSQPFAKTFFLKKGKGAKASLMINQAASKGCLMKHWSQPLLHLALMCRFNALFAPSRIVIWRYSFKIHFQEKHPTAPFAEYNHIWSLTNFEIREINRIWADCAKVMVKYTKKSKLLPLCISEDHHAQIPSSNKAPVLQEGNSSQRSESESDSKDSNDSEDKGYKNAKVQNRCIHWLQPNNGNTSVNSEIGRGFVETVDSAGNLEGEIVCGVQNSEGVVMFVDREVSTIDSGNENIGTPEDLTKRIGPAWASSMTGVVNKQRYPPSMENDAVMLNDTGRPKWKRIQRKHLTDTNFIVQYHLDCMKLEIKPQKFCKACKASGAGGKHSQQ